MGRFQPVGACGFGFFICYGAGCGPDQCAAGLSGPASAGRAAGQDMAKYAGRGGAGRGGAGRGNCYLEAMFPSEASITLHLA